jgi:Flp pilus assembly protein TadD
MIALFLFAASFALDDSYRAGLIALQQGDLAAAQTNLEAARAASPRDGRIWVALSQTYWRQHKNTDAEDAATKAASLAPDDAVVLQALAIYYTETNQPLKSARVTAKYSAPKAAELYFAAAKPLLDQQKFADAVVILEESVKRVPRNAQLELALGVACYDRHRTRDRAALHLPRQNPRPDPQ